jgi:hypothetical protein
MTGIPKMVLCWGDFTKTFTSISSPAMSMRWTTPTIPGRMMVWSRGNIPRPFGPTTMSRISVPTIPGNRIRRKAIGARRKMSTVREERDRVLQREEGTEVGEQCHS